MKKLIGLLLLAFLIGLGWTFMPQKLAPVPEFAGQLPPASPPEGMSLSALPTGLMKSQAGFAYRGGSLLEQRDFAMTPVLVRHPRGDLLFDAGFGSHVDSHVRTLPLLMQVTTQYEKSQSAADQLRAGGYDPKQLTAVVLTHAHWDHVSGLDSLPGVPVMVSTEERDFIQGGSEPVALAASLRQIRYLTYGFSSGEYLGFPRSHDVWGDGSVVLVPAPGHTPGSVLAFITLPSGARHVLLGDLVWQREGIDLPAERPWVSRWLLQEDRDQVRQAILQVAALQRRFPELNLLPAHDARAMAMLPVFPEVAR